MSDIPNPDLLPAAPAVTLDEAGNFVVDGAKIPRWQGPCLSCAHFWAFALASDSRQVFVDKAGVERRRLFLTWKRYCTYGKDDTEIGDVDIAFCFQYEHDPEAQGRWEKLRGKAMRPGNPPVILEDGTELEP